MVSWTVGAIAPACPTAPRESAAVPSVRIVGNGRAGGSFAGALGDAGWEVVGVLGRDDDPSHAAEGADLVLLAVPDSAVEAVAASIDRHPATVIAHCSGALGLAPLAGHWRRAVLHPLASLPNATEGATNLRNRCWYGVSAEGDALALEAVEALAGRPVVIAEDDWVRYHAAAAIAANHFVGLMGQVERIAERIGVPIDAYLDLTSGAWGNVAQLGAAAALTGPVARGDWATVERHLAALPEDERAAYQAGVDLCRRLLPPS
jgi:predicted short-subunit dehydrogenase-like oxidoreductase (DUF2520 family)